MKGSGDEMEVGRDGKAFARLGGSEVVQFSAFLGGRNEGGLRFEGVAEPSVDVGVVTELPSAGVGCEAGKFVASVGEREEGGAGKVVGVRGEVIFGRGVVVRGWSVVVSREVLRG